MSKTAASNRVDTAGRGKLVGGPGGVCGRLVGILNGCRWVAWEQAAFAMMCRTFDALAK